ncbi:MAG: AI-2E family transporter [Parvibaculales bacterium]
MTTRTINLYLLLGVSLYLIYNLSDIMLPFVAGFAIAYLLDPVADRLEDMGLPRIAATAIITIVFMVLILAGIFLGLPIMAEQIVTLLEVMPDYIERLRAWAGGLDNNEQTSQVIERLSQDALNTLGGLGQELFLKSLSFINVLALLVVTPVVAVYILNDWDRMVANIDRHLPPQRAPQIREIARQIDEVLTGFVHGQGVVCLFLGTFYAIGLYWIGLEGGVLTGMMAGLVSFIPYIGAIFGVTVAVILGAFQFWPEWQPFAMMALVFGVGQFIEGNFLTPRLIGERVRLHPVWIMFALLAFGSLFGFLGLLLAVPVAATLGVLVRSGVEVYEEIIDAELHAEDSSGADGMS